jgi:hypothetical protein
MTSSITLSAPARSPSWANPECEAHARKLGHPFDLGFALVNCGRVYDIPASRMSS